MTKTIIIKVGTGYIFNKLKDGTYDFNVNNLYGIAEEISTLLNNNFNLSLVSSGSVGAAIWKLKITEAPNDSQIRSALSGFGQPILMNTYIYVFSKYGKFCAQCLIDYHDLNKEEMTNTIIERQKFYNGNKDFILIYNGNAFLKSYNNDILTLYLAKCLRADAVFMFSNHVEGLGTGGGESKEEMRNSLIKEKIKFEIINDNYENHNNSGDKKYIPKIMPILL